MKLRITLLMMAFFVSFSAIYAGNEEESELLNLPGDNLDLYAVLDLFQKSKTIEEFEADLNKEETGINNLDLNLDDEVDFIKVETQQDKDDFAFVLQVDISEKETQDVAVILVSKDKEDKVSIQMVGDKDLYGKDYVIEPKTEAPSVTANPAYSGADTIVVKSEPATVVIVEQEPIVQYVYSPVYVPYYPPYYYGYYPPYYHPYPVISINIYFGRNRYHHNRYHGGHRGGNNTIIINNNNTYNNYNRTRNTSNTFNNNKSQGKYKQSNKATRPANKDVKPSTKPASRPSTKPASKPATKPANKPTTRPATKPSTQPAAKPATRPATAPAARPATMPAAKPAAKPAKRRNR